jgi:hypothetical protein
MMFQSILKVLKSVPGRIGCFGFAMIIGVAFPQQSTPLVVDIASCVGIASVLERLECFDDLARAAQAQAAATPAPASADRFGLPDEEERPRGRREPEGVQEIRGEVAALREIVPGQLEITLTNGQVWRQTNSDRYALQPGFAVRIYPTRFGQYYRLTAEVLRGFVQVERIR